MKRRTSDGQSIVAREQVSVLGRPGLATSQGCHAELQGHLPGQALGQQGDVAFVFAASLGEPEIQRLAIALEQRQVGAIWVGNRGPGLSMTVVDVSIETRLTLNGALAICLARLIDTHTFGPMGD